MKKLFLIILVSFGIFTSIVEAKNLPHSVGVSFSVFYTELRPYGEWIEIDYGIYAWRPLYISFGWKPYSIGRWVWTPYGWYWDSYEPFGWVVYHYGRWYYDEYYGWLWIPDYEWAPAWVEWRYTDYYVGWAPLPPYAAFSINIGIHFSINWYTPHYYYVFVPVRYFCGYDVHRYIVKPNHNYRIYREARVSTVYSYRNGTIINLGVDKNFIERKVGRINEVRIKETTQLRELTDRRSYDEVPIYRPEKKTENISRDINFSFTRPGKPIRLEIDKIRTPKQRLEARITEEQSKNYGTNFDNERSINRIEEREVNQYSETKKNYFEREINRNERNRIDVEQKREKEETMNRETYRKQSYESPYKKIENNSPVYIDRNRMNDNNYQNRTMERNENIKMDDFRRMNKPNSNERSIDNDTRRFHLEKENSFKEGRNRVTRQR